MWSFSPSRDTDIRICQSLDEVLKRHRFDIINEENMGLNLPIYGLIFRREPLIERKITDITSY